MVCDLKESTYLVLSFRSHTTAFLTEQLSSVKHGGDEIYGSQQVEERFPPAEHHRRLGPTLGKTKELAHFCGVLDSVDGDRIGSAGGNRSSQAYDRKFSRRRSSFWSASSRRSLEGFVEESLGEAHLSLRFSSPSMLDEQLLFVKSWCVI